MLKVKKIPTELYFMKLLVNLIKYITLGLNFLGGIRDRTNSGSKQSYETKLKEIVSASWR